MNTNAYNGYRASVEADGGMLFVKVLGIGNLLLGECKDIDDAPRVLKDLADCRQVIK